MQSHVLRREEYQNLLKFSRLALKVTCRTQPLTLFCLKVIRWELENVVMLGL